MAAIAAAAAVASFGVADALVAQDLEMDALVRSRALPASYWSRVADRPDFFEVERGWSARGRAAMAGGPALEGELPLLVVPVLFADSPEPPVPAVAIERVIFTGPYAPGTLAEYYADQSRGRLTLTGRVVEWVRSGLTVAQVRGRSYGIGEDARTGDWVTDALEAVDGTVDFRAFDNDGPDGVPDSGDDDGFVDALVIEFLEHDVTCRGQGPTIWAHRSAVEHWNGEPWVSDDVGASGEPIRANDYITQPGVHCDGRVADVVVVAHEMGHILGLPDLYDSTEGILPEQRSWVVGCWSVMAAGQWGCGPGPLWDRPPSFGPWEKAALGWLPGVTVADDAVGEEFTLRPMESSGDALRIDLSPTEHFLVEYRAGTGFDRNLPATGVLIHRVDETRPSSNSRCRGCPQLYEVSLLEADADRSLLLPEGQGGRRGEPGDVFGPSGPTRLTDGTVPSTRLASGAASGVTIEDIRVEDGVAKLVVSTHAIPLDRLVAELLGGDGPGLTAEEAAYLDRVGNRNGRYDVADLRLHLRGGASGTAAVGGDARDAPPDAAANAAADGPHGGGG